MNEVLRAWTDLRDLPCEVLEGGLINASYRLGDPPVAVVQRLHPVFAPEVNQDIAAITAHVARRGLVTPTVLATDDGALWVLDQQGACWRALSWVPGVTHHKLRDPSLASEAGALVARWHRAVDDLDHAFAFGRAGVHDTPAHLARLRGAVAECGGHRLHGEVAALTDEVLGRFETWQGRLQGPERLTHGDLKISNLRFTDDGRGLCLLDLDTMGRLSLDVELGDAWRSWCNPASEDARETVFDLGLFEASARGYLAEQPLPAEEREALPGGIERICLELSARFAADALREAYFGWDPAVAPTRGDHNLLRARGQLALARSVRAQRSSLERVLREAG